MCELHFLNNIYKIIYYLLIYSLKSVVSKHKIVQYYIRAAKYFTLPTRYLQHLQLVTLQLTASSHTVKALHALSPWGAYLILGLKKGAFISYFKDHKFLRKLTLIFQTLLLIIITPLTKTEQEMPLGSY